MAVKSGKSGSAREKTYYKVSFARDNEMYQVCARSVQSSDLFGLIEIADFIFPSNRLVYNPGEERIRREFSGIRRTWIPYHAIVRIDEVLDTTESEVKIVPLESVRAAPSAASPVVPFPAGRGRE
jgi:hypothetical protein